MLDERYFGEKSSELDTDSLIAFGIRLWSRYSKAEEMREMLAFATKAAKENLHYYVEEIFYDSKAEICSFTFFSEVEERSDLADRFRAIASKTIRQYEIFGEVGHRGISLAANHD
ncbi:TPA: hypothetical protein P2B70_003301 [Salmonella enterica subsp. enterica serovar Eastbourne]|nr:hypothetical protein [Salmonella enterica subsp. enterica serovar Eastbourne]HDN7573158.1 hypothetical protein [Salmonella enterica subsp. enterica serovar Eastbourne]